MRWFFREIELAKANVSNTTVHSVYLSPDTSKIVDYLNEVGGRKVVVAMPGVASRSMDAASGQPVVDSFDSPIISDLNPVVSGFSGAYTYAGHWSETPNYDKRRGELTRLFATKATLTEQTAVLSKIGADYVIQPDPVTFGVQDLRPLGEVVVAGTTLSLVKLRK
jgi:arabinosyltransferase C